MLFNNKNIRNKDITLHSLHLKSSYLSARATNNDKLKL